MACGSCGHNIMGPVPTFTSNVPNLGSSKGVIRASQLAGSKQAGEVSPSPAISTNPVDGDAGPSTKPVEKKDDGQ